jgi:hypothetical protein
MRWRKLLGALGMMAKSHGIFPSLQCWVMYLMGSVAKGSSWIIVPSLKRRNTNGQGKYTAWEIRRRLGNRYIFLVVYFITTTQFNNLTFS